MDPTTTSPRLLLETAPIKPRARNLWTSSLRRSGAEALGRLSREGVCPWSSDRNVCQRLRRLGPIRGDEAFPKCLNPIKGWGVPENTIIPSKSEREPGRSYPRSWKEAGCEKWEWSPPQEGKTVHLPSPQQPSIQSWKDRSFKTVCSRNFLGVLLSVAFQRQISFKPEEPAASNPSASRSLGGCPPRAWDRTANTKLKLDLK